MKTPVRTRTRGTRQGGFSMVEVLVALVVLSMGLLGIAKMVLLSSHSNDSAYLRSQATALAYQMLDDMRANLGGAAAGSYNTALGVMPAAPSSCLETTCSNTALASWDVYSWKQHLATALAAGTGSIVTSATNPLTATIVVQWDDSAGQAAFGAVAAGTAAPMSITLQTVLQ